MPKLRLPILRHLIAAKLLSSGQFAAEQVGENLEFRVGEFLARQVRQYAAA